MKTIRSSRKLKLPDGLLDGILFEVLDEAQKFIFLLLLFQAAQSTTPGCLLIPTNAFARFIKYNISPEDLDRTLRILESHQLIEIMLMERMKVYFISIKNWQDYDVH